MPVGQRIKLRNLPIKMRHFYDSSLIPIYSRFFLFNPQTATTMFISEDPPLFVVSIRKDTLAHRLIEKTEQLVLHAVSTEQVNLAKKLGHEKATDKMNLPAASSRVSEEKPLFKRILPYPVASYRDAIQFRK